MNTYITDIEYTHVNGRTVYSHEDTDVSGTLTPLKLPYNIGSMEVKFTFYTTGESFQGIDSIILTDSVGNQYKGTNYRKYKTYEGIDNIVFCTIICDFEFPTNLSTSDLSRNYNVIVNVITPDNTIISDYVSDSAEFGITQVYYSGGTEGHYTGITPYNDQEYIEISQFGSACMNKIIAQTLNIDKDSIYIKGLTSDDNMFFVTEPEYALYNVTLTPQSPPTKGLITCDFCVLPNEIAGYKYASFTVYGLSTYTGKPYSCVLTMKQDHSDYSEHVHIDSFSVDYIGNTIEVYGSYDNGEVSLGSNVVTSSSPWVTVVDTNNYVDDQGVGRIRAVLSIGGNAGADRVGSLSVNTTEGVTTHSNQFVIYQQGKVNADEHPSWQDYFLQVEFDDDDEDWKEIRIADGILDYAPQARHIYYTGKVWKTSTRCDVNLKEIFENNIDVEWGIGADYYNMQPNQYKPFYVYVGQVLKKIVYVHYDYDFCSPAEYVDLGQYPYLQNNIFGEVDPRQHIFISAINTNNSSISSLYVGYKLNGTDTVVTDEPLLNQAMTYSKYVGSGTTSILPFIIDDGGGHTVVDNYKVICEDTKHKYALYYLNKRGGWDWILLNSSSYATGNKTTQTITIDGDDPHSVNNPINRQIIPYMTQSNLSWQVNTDLFMGIDKVYVKSDGTSTTKHLSPDDQMKLMDNVFLSPQMYLHDFETNAIYAVNLEDSQMVFKTINQNGNKLFNCSLKLRQAQNRYSK